jgi:hypothetical protein
MTSENYALCVSKARREFASAFMAAHSSIIKSMTLTNGKIIESEKRLERFKIDKSVEKKAYDDIVKFVLTDTGRSLGDIVKTYSKLLGSIDTGYYSYYKSAITEKRIPIESWENQNQENFFKRATCETAWNLFREFKEFVKCFGRPTHDDVTEDHSIEAIVKLSSMKKEYDMLKRIYITPVTIPPNEDSICHPINKLFPKDDIWNSPSLVISAVDLILSEFYIYNIIQTLFKFNIAKFEIERETEELKRFGDYMIEITTANIYENYGVFYTKSILEQTMKDAEIITQDKVTIAETTDSIYAPGFASASISGSGSG